MFASKKEKQLEKRAMIGKIMTILICCLMVFQFMAASASNVYADGKDYTNWDHWDNFKTIVNSEITSRKATGSFKASKEGPDVVGMALKNCLDDDSTDKATYQQLKDNNAFGSIWTQIADHYSKLTDDDKKYVTNKLNVASGYTKTSAPATDTDKNKGTSSGGTKASTKYTDWDSWDTFKTQLKSQYYSQSTTGISDEDAVANALSASGVSSGTINRMRENGQLSTIADKVKDHYTSLTDDDRSFIEQKINTADADTEETPELEAESSDSNLLTKALADIFNWITKPFRHLFLDITNAMLNGISGKFSQSDPWFMFSKMFKTGSVASTTAGGEVNSDAGLNIYNTFAALGIAVLIVTTFLALFISLIDDSAMAETPTQIMVGAGLSMIGVGLTWRIMRIINGFFFGTTTNSSISIMGLFSFSSVNAPESGGPINTTTLDQMVSDMVNQQEGLDDLVSTFLVITIEFVLFIQFVRVVLEVIERWILLDVLYMMAPMFIGFGASRNTRDVTKKFFRAYCTQSLIMCLNVFFVQLAVRTLNNYTTPADNDTSNILSNPLVYLLVVLGILQLATRLDEYLGSLGMSAIHTGGGLAGAVVGGAATLIGATRQGIRAGVGAGRSIGQSVTSHRNNMDARSNGGRIYGLKAKKEPQAAANAASKGQWTSAQQFGRADMSLSPAEMKAQKRPGAKMGTFQYDQGANLLARMAQDNGVSDDQLAFRQGSGTWWDADKQKGHADVMFGGPGGIPMSGEISTEHTPGSIDIGGGFFMKPDDGSQYIGGDLGANMQTGDIASLSDFNAENHNALNAGVMAGLGVSDADSVRKEANGVSVGHYDPKSDTFTPSAVMSYDKDSYNGAAMTDADGTNVMANGNQLYGYTTGNNNGYSISSGQKDNESAAFAFCDAQNAKTQGSPWHVGRGENGESYAVHMTPDGKIDSGYRFSQPSGKHEFTAPENGMVTARTPMADAKGVKSVFSGNQWQDYGGKGTAGSTSASGAASPSGSFVRSTSASQATVAAGGTVRATSTTVNASVSPASDTGTAAGESGGVQMTSTGGFNHQGAGTGGNGARSHNRPKNAAREYNGAVPQDGIKANEVSFRASAEGSDAVPHSTAGGTMSGKGTSQHSAGGSTTDSTYHSGSMESRSYTGTAGSVQAGGVSVGSTANGPGGAANVSGARRKSYSQVRQSRPETVEIEDRGGQRTVSQVVSGSSTPRESVTVNRSTGTSGSSYGSSAYGGNVSARSYRRGNTGAGSTGSAAEPLPEKPTKPEKHKPKSMKEKEDS